MSDTSRRNERGSHLRWVALGEMRVNPRAQREFRPSHAEQYAADFDFEGFGFPVVNRRDGHYYIVDGQHRVAALRLTGFGPEQQIQCECYEGLTEDEEAELFLKRSNQRAIRPFDKFRIAITAGREVECDIERTVMAQGLKVASGEQDGNIGAVTALRKVYDLGGAVVLGRALRILRDAYAAHPSALRGQLIEGLGFVCQRYNGALNDEVAKERLAKIPGGALGLLGKAEVIRRQTGRPKNHCVAAAVVDTMNAGRGGKKLDPWWSER